MQVSVVIPVYNAARYVTQAVESALQQPETAEVLLVEDGSPDNALQVCLGLAEKLDKVKLLRHPNGENRGAGASRNLGMQNAHFDTIAFLDADDFYLPGRFSVAQEIFDNDPACEGVYEAVGMHVENLNGMERWTSGGKPVSELHTMKKSVNPEELPSALLNSGVFGSFHLDGLIIKNNVLEKSGYMDEKLKTATRIRNSYSGSQWLPTFTRQAG